MLQLILGRAGSGKTTRIKEQIADCLSNQQRVYLIVPEQFSFETEKNLVAELCGPQFFRLQVVSFTRLAQQILETYGGQPADLLDEGARCLLAAKAAILSAHELQVYQEGALSPGFLRNLMQLFHQAGNGAVTPAQLQEAATYLPQSTALRLQDLAGLYATYQALMADNRLDATHLVGKAAEMALKNNFFAQSHVFLDGFDGFSGAQMGMIEVMLAQCPKVTASLCTNDLAGSGSSAFAAPAKTGTDLRRLAQKLGVPVDVPTLLTGSYRFKNQGLVDLESGFLCAEKPKSADTQGGIIRLAADDIYQQAEGICAQIKEAVFARGLRYRDVVVITRNLASTRDIYATAFDTYEIPLFLDRREKVSGTPLFLFLSGALSAVQYRWRTEDMLRLAKSGAFGFEPIWLSKLENYCYVWRIEGAAWKKPFEANPAGLGQKRTEETQAELTQLEAMRQAMMRPLLFLKQDLDGCNGQAFAAALVALCNKTDCYAHLLKNAHDLQQMGEVDLAARFMQVWDCFVTMCDRLATILGDVSLSFQEWCRIFDLLKEQYDVGQLPTTIDSVLIGDAQRIRPDNRKLCFVADFCQGLYPLEQTAHAGLISRKDLQALEEMGIHLQQDDEEVAMHEDYYAYAALTCASDQVVICTPRADRQYAPLEPSRYVKEIAELFFDVPCVEVENLPLTQLAASRQALFCQAAKWALKPTKEAVTLAALLPELQQQMLAQTTHKTPFCLQNKQTAAQLFGRNMHLSASKIERYYQCPFAYFLQYGLRLKERRRAEFDPMNSGTLIHFVLEQMLQKFAPDALLALSDNALLCEVRGQINAFLEADEGLEQMLSPRQKGQLTRIAKALCAMLTRLCEEFVQSKFQPVDFELSIGGQESEVEPLILETPDGARVHIEGKVDRVDTWKRSDVTYLRVVDYKSGGKSFRLQDVYYGLNLQMLLYLFILCDQGKERYPSPLPAGVLYFPAKAEAVKIERDDNDEKRKKSADSRFKMDGLLLDDPALIEAMEPGAAGLFLPIAKKKDGSYASKAADHLASLSELGALRRQVERLLAGMADSLLAGEIAALPTKDGDKSTEKGPCDFCKYHAACRREDADPLRDAAAINRQEIFHRLAQLDQAEGVDLHEA